ncbi:MAG: hypothetical protein ACK5NF_06335 [Bacilli bacterium]
MGLFYILSVISLGYAVIALWDLVSPVEYINSLNYENLIMQPLINIRILLPLFIYIAIIFVIYYFFTGWIMSILTNVFSEKKPLREHLLSKRVLFWSGIVSVIITTFLYLTFDSILIIAINYYDYAISNVTIAIEKFPEDFKGLSQEQAVYFLILVKSSIETLENWMSMFYSGLIITALIVYGKRLIKSAGINFIKKLDDIVDEYI